jgi:NADH-quinone oxidoreductase subunit L
VQNYVWLIPALPFIAFVLTLLVGKWWLKGSAHWIPILAMAGSFALSIAAFVQIRGAEHPFVVDYWRWIGVGKFQTTWGMQIDQLSAVMLLVVTGVGLLIFVYSRGYMRGDPGFYRFFAYMSLFAFAMLMLVTANNYLLVYLGWEGVGLCSYYLIGFFYHKQTAASAGKKAFIVTRIGDMGFAIGVLMIFVTFGTLNFTDVFGKVSAGGVSSGALLAIALLLFMGAMGKSAQFPLHVWLPDAMEGPTPVSALIHAATMVTAGVYLVARSSVIFASSHTALMVMGGIGAFTAIFAAIIGITQNDIKKVLAYSTISQLGYMFMALAVAAWPAAIFHLVTHAFFKALLFLGAGSVIHSMGGEQDMRCMGGLARRIPVTYITFIAGALALSGIFPFAGFWSKDEILGKSFGAGVYILWVVGIGAAFVTAFYTFRMIFVTFWGKQTRSPSDTCARIHESPPSMILPLIVLAIASTLGGFLGLPGTYGVMQRFLEPVFAPANAILGITEHGLSLLDVVLMIVSLGVALIGIALAWFIYIWGRDRDLAQLFATRLRPIYNTVNNKFYIDEVYDATVVRLVVDGSRRLYHGFDEKVIDGAVNGVGTIWSGLGRAVRPIQTGRVQNYLLGMFVGLFVVVTAALFLLAR